MNMPESRPLLLGCGILRREIRFLLERNRWAADTFFLDSALHIDLAELSGALSAALAKHAGRDMLVFYGCCHPRIDQIVAEAGASRIPGQNCAEMLLGPERFTEELARGAFFLLEDWARRWGHILATTFGADIRVVRSIFQGDRKYLLGLRTPCSEDFQAEAEAARRQVGLPLRWMDVPLDHLERLLQIAITRKTGEK
jgi:hypothetical protein